MAIRFTGQLRTHVTGKDVALEVMRRLGEGGGRYRAIEYYDGDGGLTMAARMTLTNMAVDCGAKNGLFVPDAITAAYLCERDGGEPEGFDIEPGDGYVEEIQIDLQEGQMNITMQYEIVNVDIEADIISTSPDQGKLDGAWFVCQQ